MTPKFQYFNPGLTGNRTIPGPGPVSQYLLTTIWFFLIGTVCRSLAGQNQFRLFLKHLYQAAQALGSIKSLLTRLLLYWNSDRLRPNLVTALSGCDVIFLTENQHSRITCTSRGYYEWHNVWYMMAQCQELITGQIILRKSQLGLSCFEPFLKCCIRILTIYTDLPEFFLIMTFGILGEFS